MRRSGKARVWTWLLAALPVLLALWSAYLVWRVSQLQELLRQDVGLIRQIEAVRVAVHGLEEAATSALDPARAAEAEQRWPTILAGVRARLAALPGQRIAAMGMEPGQQHCRAALEKLEELFLARPAAGASGPEVLGFLAAFYGQAELARLALTGMVDSTRQATAAISRDLAVHWNALNLLVALACIMAVLVLVLLHGYRRQLAARRELEQERERFFELHADLLCIASLDGFFQHLNPAWETVLGYSRAELCRWPWIDFVHPEDRAATLQAGAGLAAGQPLWGFENRYRTRAGDYRWLVWNATPDLGRGTLYATARDVTALKLAEQRLADARSYALNLVDCSLDMIIAVDPQQRIVEFNRAAEETFGYTRAEVLGQSVDLLYTSPADGAHVHQVLTRDGRFRGEIISRRKNGELFPRLLAASRLKDAQGRALGAMGVSREITEAKRKEQELRESEQRIRVLYEASTGLELGTAGQFTEMLRIAAAFLGQEIGLISRVAGPQYIIEHLHDSSGRLERQQILELNETFCALALGQADVVAIDCAAREQPQHAGYARFGLQAYIGAPFRVGEQMHGTLCFVSFQPRVRPWSAGDREFVRLLAQWVGRTLERRRAEEGLRESEARYRLLADSMEDFVSLNDAQGQRLYVSPSFYRVTGYAPDEVLQSDFRQRIHPEDVPVIDAARAANLCGESTRTEFRFRLPDGAYIWLEVQATPIFGPDGAVEKTVCCSREITGRKRAQAALEQAQVELRDFAARLERSNRELEDFASVASHDLQEPLRKVMAFGDRLKTRCAAALDEQGRDYLERMQNAARRMQTLIEDLLTYSRVATRAQAFVAVDLNQVLREVLSDLEVRIEEMGAQIEAGPLPALAADPLQMRQLLQNLIGNALKFHKPGQPARVRITAADGLPAGQVQLLVADDGIGFDEKYRERIFNVFQRLHGRGEYEGTGIGLAVCRKIVERHRGTITARSQPQAGATFIVTLPVAQRGPAATAADAQPDAAPGP